MKSIFVINFVFDYSLEVNSLRLGGAVAVVIVVCVGFMLVLMVIGILRMRETPIERRRDRKNTVSDRLFKMRFFSCHFSATAIRMQQ